MQSQNARDQSVTCCIAGGGPAGIMLGLLLARAGVETLVLEKHADFLRDFRGDTIHPSTLQVMHELGLLRELLARPHQKLAQLGGMIGDTHVTLADFSHAPTVCQFIALMPQWHFLNFLTEAGRRYPNFHLRMEAEVLDLIEEDGRIAGVRATTPDGPLEIRAELTIGADGRHSTVRERAGLTVHELGAPIDVLWMRISKGPDDPPDTLGRINYGRMLVTLDRGDYWQCAYIIRKDGFAGVKARGLPAFREDLLRIAPFFRDRVDELTNWDDIKLLTVAVDRMEKWSRPGLLCIGDCAHAMSPMGGVGINLAIQDAVAAGNILAGPLATGRLTTADLEAVQKRRMWPTRATQKLQVVMQERVIDRFLGNDKPMTKPSALKLFDWFPVLRRLPARVIGIGIRPEHVQIPEKAAARP